MVVRKGSDKQQALVNCVFASATRELLDETAFDRLVRDYQGRKASGALTGLVLYEGGNLFQVIEGPRDEVEAMYLSISLDTVHRNMVKILEEPIAERNFDQLSAAYGDGIRKVLAGQRKSGADDSRLCQARALSGPGRTKKLLQQFVDGRWRLFNSGW